MYRVTAHRIVRAGSSVYTTSAERLVLETCYPFTALYLTETGSAVEIMLDVSGSHPVRARFNAAITAEPNGRYDLIVSEAVRHGEFVVTGFAMTPRG